MLGCMKQGAYADQSASFQLFLLLGFLLAGLCLSSLLAGVVVWCCNGSLQVMYQDPWMMRLTQFISAVGTFLLPSLLVAWCCGHSVRAYLSIGPVPRIHAFVWVFISMLLLIPGINLLDYANRQLVLPDWMAPVESWIQAQEAQAERLVSLLFSQEGILPLLSNLLVVALMAGITEEFLFRGCLQQIVRRWTRNPHTVIWIVAFLFSAIHLQFYGFVPRMLLGAYVGYLLYGSRNIWIPVFAHFCNNALVVLLQSHPDWPINPYCQPDLTQGIAIHYIIVALLLLLPFGWILRNRLQIGNTYHK